MSEDSGGLSNSNEDEPPDEIGDILPAPINGDEEELQEVIGENLPASINGNNEEQHLVGGKKLQEKCLRIVSLVSRARRYCCFAVIILIGSLIASFVFWLVREKNPAIVSPEAGNDTCPKDWIAFGSKCFYLSEDTSNWTSSQTSCMEIEANLTHFDSLEELDFLNRYKGDSAAWIGLHRESSKQPWMWTDNTEYNNLTLIRGVGNHGYLSDRGISSSRDYIPRRWICSKPKK